MSVELISSQLDTLTTDQLWELHSLVIDKLRPSKKKTKTVSDKPKKKSPWIDEVKAVLEDMRKTNPQAKYKDAITEASSRRTSKNQKKDDLDSDTITIDSDSTIL